MRFSPGCRVIDAVALLLLGGAAVAQDVVEVPTPSSPTAVTPDDPAVPAPTERPRDAAALFAAFAEMKGMEARFEEEKHLALLAAPLESAGRLHFLAPGYLARVVERPTRSAVRITPTELRVEGEDGVERIDLRQSDDVRVFVTSLVSVFRGDEAALRESYRVTFTPGEDATTWTLTLEPERPPLTKLMKSLTLAGDGRRVRSIEVVEPNGDRTITRIVEADVTRVYTDAEKERLFGIDPD